MFKKLFTFLLIFSLSLAHFSVEECFQLEDCPKCEKCVEKECPPCPELIECECDPCPECPEVCNGTCYLDEEVINIEKFIQELEYKDSINIQIQSSMQLELNQWMIQDSTYQSLIRDMEHTIVLRDKLIKEVTPKWWENKWLFFFGGVVIMGSVNSIVD